jgi:hypothetical protein
VNNVKDFVRRVERPCDANVADGFGFEVERLPRLKSFVLLVNDEIPGCRVGRCFDEETVKGN